MERPGLPRVVKVERIRQSGGRTFVFDDEDLDHGGRLLQCEMCEERSGFEIRLEWHRGGADDGSFRLEREKGGHCSPRFSFRHGAPPYLGCGTMLRRMGRS